MEVRAESANGQYFDSAPKELSELLFKTDDVEERPASLNVDKQINVAFRMIIAPRNRSEYTNIACAVPSGYGQDFMPSQPQFVDRHHSIIAVAASLLAKLPNGIFPGLPIALSVPDANLEMPLYSWRRVFRRLQNLLFRFTKIDGIGGGGSRTRNSAFF